MKKILTILVIMSISLAMAQENEYLPLVREGVKWVNEKVIINNGDTTSYYYIYEIQGDSPTAYIYSQGNAKLCHYYTGSRIDYNNDSIISSLEDRIQTVLCFENHALDKTDSEGRHLLWRPKIISSDVYDCEKLYEFFHQDPQFVVYNYIENWSMLSNYLNNENFIVAEPIQIENHNCVRFAHINEQGDTLAYMVEGIGFDSRDMGDLLTPFTRKPDPDADYQEYCGLCHVVKDGKIIYKGMRYNPNNLTGINEVVADKTPHVLDGNYYNLMGVPVGKELPTTPGIYIHQGKKYVVR